MNFYWIYDLPNWLFALLSIGFMVFFAIGGLMLFRGFIFRRVIQQAHNDVVSYFMSGMGAIYGITLGLIAVAAWEAFSDVEEVVAKEASTLIALYNDVGTMPSPLSDSLQAQLKEYTLYTINDAWPKQRIGIVPRGGTERLRHFNNTLISYEPSTKMQEILCKEAIEGLYQLTELRQIRLQKVKEGLPAAVWYVIFFGALLNIVITWFFITDRFRVHILMTCMYAALLGSLIFLVAAMDNPFRGEFSVGTEALEAVLAKMK
jgi:hypothetical protein